MDWAKAIEFNQSALARIVAALFAMLAFAGSSAGARILLPLHRAVSRVLHPAESAVRRLIVIAARGVVVKVLPARTMPPSCPMTPASQISKGFAPAGTRRRRVSFRLFDKRQQFLPWRPTPASAKDWPRIHFFGVSPLVPLFQRQSVERRSAVREVAKPDGTVSALRLGLRLAAVKMALDDLPRQAFRLARWRIRRKAMRSPTFTSPLRPGPPPGYRKKPVEEIDFVLKECHALAWDVLKEDTS